MKTRRERPLCRQAIAKYGLHFARNGERGAGGELDKHPLSPINVVDREGRYVSVSHGLLIQLRKQAEEEAER
jgi:hypothetical protein